MKNKEQIKQKLVELAQKVFARLGYDRTTMEIIAKEARRGKSTLYYYFKSKEDIFAAVIDREGKYIQNELMKIINKNTDIRSIIKQYVIKRYELFDELVNYYNVFKEDYLANMELIEKYRQKHDEFEFWAMKQILIKGIINNELKIQTSQVDDVALAIAVALKGLEIPLFLENQWENFEKKIDNLLNILFCGIAKEC